LGQHDVTSGKCSLGGEAPSPVDAPVGGELYDVHDLSAENPVARAGVAAHDLETLVFVILFGLLGRKPLTQEILASLFALSNNLPGPAPSRAANSRFTGYFTDQRFRVLFAVSFTEDGSV
jgi:hypothetical protein